MAVQWSDSPQAGNIFQGVFVRLDVRQRLLEVSGPQANHRWVRGVGGDLIYSILFQVLSGGDVSLPARPRDIFSCATMNREMYGMVVMVVLVVEVLSMVRGWGNK